MKNLIVICIILSTCLMSCEKEIDGYDKNRESEDSSELINETEETGSYFDEKYIDELESISGVHPSDLAQDILSQEYFNSLNSLNDCFLAKMKMLRKFDNQKFWEIYGDLQDIEVLISNGDNHSALKSLEAVYAEVECGTGEITYEDIAYNLPLEEFRLISDSISIRKNLLLENNQGLNELSESQFKDFMVISYLYFLESNQKAATPKQTCCSVYRGNMLAVKSSMHTCMDVAPTYFFEAVCAITAGIQGLVITDQYYTCVDNGGTGC